MKYLPSLMKSSPLPLPDLIPTLDIASDTLSAANASGVTLKL